MSVETMSVPTLYLSACVAKLEQLTSRIAACLGKLTDDQIWARGHENENAIGNLVLHLAGNVRQRIMSALGGNPMSANATANSLPLAICGRTTLPGC